MQVARERGWPLYVCNDALLLAPDAALLHACNYQWWQRRWPLVRDLPCEKWTTNAQAAKEFGINWISEVNKPGLSTSRDVLHHGHSSGYQLVGMAHRNGAERIVLLGYDLAFARDYDGKAQRVGATPRHFFGEYEPALQHWPSVQVKLGRHVELIGLYESVAKQGLVEIVNCTPGSALECFPRADIKDV